MIDLSDYKKSSKDIFVYKGRVATKLQIIGRIWSQQSSDLIY